MSLLPPSGHAERADLRSALRDLRGRQEAVLNTYANGAAEALTNVYQYGVLGGAAMTAGAYVHRVVNWYQNGGVAVDARDVKTFFEMTEEQQYRVAERHPQFAAALIALDEQIAGER